MVRRILDFGIWILRENYSVVHYSLWDDVDQVASFSCCLGREFVFSVIFQAGTRLKGKDKKNKKS